MPTRHLEWRMNVRALAAMGCVIASSLAAADPAKITYYDIYGSSGRELRRELDAKGPVSKAGVRGDGIAYWSVNWNFRYVPSSGGCRFSEITVTVTGDIILPRWEPGEIRSDGLAKKWRAYLSALLKHEYGHYNHGMRAGEEIRSLGQTFRVTGDCSRIGQDFNDRAALILEKYRAMDGKYDIDTGHGRTQGAVFP